MLFFLVIFHVLFEMNSHAMAVPFISYDMLEANTLFLWAFLSKIS